MIRRSVTPLLSWLNCGILNGTSNGAGGSMHKALNGIISLQGPHSRTQNGLILCYHTLQKQRKDSFNGFLNSSSSHILNSAFISGHFVKLKDVPKPDITTRFTRNDKYERVKSQNFGPVTASESDVPSGHYALTSWEYAKRDDLMYGKLPYHKLPVVHIHARYNNTFVRIQSFDYQETYAFVTCGTVGFRNAKKKTVHAAESVGKSAAERAVLRDCPEHVRVKIKGPGYGRASALRGLVMGGLKIASVTDITILHVDGLPQRPRAIRRI